MACEVIAIAVGSFSYWKFDTNRSANTATSRYDLCRRFLADEADFSAENMEKCGIRAENRFENRELEACVDTLVREIRAQGLALLEPKVP